MHVLPVKFITLINLKTSKHFKILIIQSDFSEELYKYIA